MLQKRWVSLGAQVQSQQLFETPDFHRWHVEYRVGRAFEAQPESLNVMLNRRALTRAPHRVVGRLQCSWTTGAFGRASDPKLCDRLPWQRSPRADQAENPPPQPMPPKLCIRLPRQRSH